MNKWEAYYCWRTDPVSDEQFLTVGICDAVTKRKICKGIWASIADVSVIVKAHNDEVERVLVAIDDDPLDKGVFPLSCLAPGSM